MSPNHASQDSPPENPTCTIEIRPDGSWGWRLKGAMPSAPLVNALEVIGLFLKQKQLAEMLAQMQSQPRRPSLVLPDGSPAPWSG